jgi:hypothetical protein
MWAYSVVDRIDVDALVEQTDLGRRHRRILQRSRERCARRVRSQAVGLDEFIARWLGRLRHGRYTGQPARLTGLRANRVVRALAPCRRPMRRTGL